MSEMTKTLEEFVTVIVQKIVLDFASNSQLDETNPFFPAGWCTEDWVKDFVEEYTDRQIERLDEEYNFDDIPDGDDFVTKETFHSITNHINERLDQIKWDSEPRTSSYDDAVDKVNRLEARELNISKRLDQIENALNHITRAGVHLNKVE